MGAAARKWVSWQQEVGTTERSMEGWEWTPTEKGELPRCDQEKAQSCEEESIGGTIPKESLNWDIDSKAEGLLRSSEIGKS